MNRRLLMFVMFAQAFVLHAQQKNCSFPNVGLKPLPDLGTSKYRGFSGGLYTNGSNVPVGNYLTDALNNANSIGPLDSSGNASPSGKIVFAGVGASNPRTEFDAFAGFCDTFKKINKKLVLVNTCIGGQGVQKMNDPLDNYWKSTIKLFDSMKLNFKQVQIVWLETDNTQAADTVFPRAPQALLQDLKVLLQTLKLKFPNLKLCYLSARAYAGWIDLSGGGSPGKGLLAPRDYYNGWAIKWLIDSASAGNVGFEYKGNNKKIALPLFGSYHWTNGSETRKDGFQFDCNTDVGNDGLHLTPAGEQKIGKAMFDFFANAETATNWFYEPKANATQEFVKPQFLLFPNPNSGSHFNIITGKEYLKVECHIYNATGQLVARTAVNLEENKGSIQLGNSLKTGTYFCRIWADGNASEIQKMWVLENE
ncbi:MAG: T9SS type A sorting domain-containing protein [Bacteroidia bacterium]|nr:T9SS type A sorting domain-containing protein [Bacteroidia bacterium]